jgi:alkylation response protein AidB-like acyl-CoA dehydrogenase
LDILSKRDNLDEFRAALRAWLEATVPADWSERMALANEQEYIAFQKWWLDELYKVGLATPHWPTKWGGQDLAVRHQRIIFEEIARANAPNPSLFTISLYHLPATLFAWATQEQIDRYLPTVAQGVIWCQGFSEPNAGSDLASLRTRAVREGDKYIINGQKVWSSYAAMADYCLLLVRTDVDAPKHKGITFLIVDMKSPGIEVRRIKQANHNDEFAEIFFDDVEVPVANRLGEENQGWQIAQSTLAAERGMIIFELSERTNYFFQNILNEVGANPTGWFQDDELRRRFVHCYTELQGLRSMIRKMLAEVEATGELGTLPSYIKILYGEFLQRFTDLLLQIEGMPGQVFRPGLICGGYPTGNALYDYISSWIWTISGGTNEVLKNVIAERLIGLPREG